MPKWSVSQITSRLACSFIYTAGAARKCGDARFSQFIMSCRVNLHANGFGVRLLNSSYNANRTRIASSFAKSFGVNTFLWMIVGFGPSRYHFFGLAGPARWLRRDPF